MPWDEFILGGAELSFLELQVRLWSVGLGEYSAEIPFLKELYLGSDLSWGTLGYQTSLLGRTLCAQGWVPLTL